MRLLSTIAVTSFLFAATANSATYYVSTTGNDSANGSSSAPFRTITKAAQVAGAGDTVNVRGGVYTDRAVITSRGTAAAPIVFRSMPGETAVLDGVNTPSNKGIVELVGAEHVEFSGFEVRNAPHIGIVIWHGRNIAVTNNYVHHAMKNAIYAGGDTTPANFDITVSGNRVHDAVRVNEFQTYTSGGWPAAVVVSRTDRATITSNRIWNNWGEGLISRRSNYHLIQGNEIFDNFSVNLYLDNSRFNTVNGNLIYSTTDSRFYRNGLPATGIGIANETKDVMNPSSDNVFTNNIVIGTRWGFYYGAYESGGGLRNTKVLHNTFYGTVAEIIRIENDTHSNNLVANNVFYQTGSPAPKYGGGTAVTYRTNLWYGGSAGVAAGATDIIADPRFTNPGGFAAADYRLLDLSPAIHTAVDLIDVTTDFFGAARTPTYDIGAHEHSLALGSSSPAQPGLEPPATLTATAPSSITVQLSWPHVEGVSGYRVYRDRALVATVTTTAWTDLNLEPGSTYTYAVTTIDGSGNESAPSHSATVSTPAVKDSQVPTAPAALTAKTSGSRVVLSWQPSSDDLGVTGYIVYRNKAVVATITETSWTDTTVTPSTTYQYDIVAFDAAQKQSPPATVTVTTDGGRGRAVGR